MFVFVDIIVFVMISAGVTTESRWGMRCQSKEYSVIVFQEPTEEVDGLVNPFPRATANLILYLSDSKYSRAKQAAV